MSGLQTVCMQCPYCGEQIEMIIDCSVGCQQYIEDCSVCCRPIAITVETADGEVVGIEGRTEND